MAVITDIVHKPTKERYWIFVDGEYCCSIRERTFPALRLEIGQQISCDEIKERENFFWKQQYGKAAWEKESVRLTKVKELIDSIDSRAVARIVGFGAGSTEFIAEHPEESGRPDVEVVTTDGQNLVLLLVEVTGTERMRGSTYWVRPDKLSYVSAHPTEDVWLILHYAEPTERFVFICPNPTRGKYETVRKEIRGATEHYVEFDDDSPEVSTFDAFRDHLLTKLA